jgi:hypothetical protein
MGGARRFFGSDQGKARRLLGGQGRQSNTLRSHSITPVSTLSGTGGNNFPNTTGGLMAGTLGFISDDLDIATGILDLTTNAAGDAVKIRKYININPETGTTDTLDLITTAGTEFPQQELILIGQSGDTLTITNDSGSAAGNNRAILCPGGVNYTISGAEAINLFYDFTLSKWRITGDANTGGGGGAGFPLAYTVDDKVTAQTGTVTHDLNAITAHKLQFTADGDCDITISNIPSSPNAVDFYIEVTQDGAGGHAITVNDSEWVSFPTLSTALDTTSLIACHADGDGNIRAILLLNSSTTAGGTGASRQLDNLSAPVLNASIDVNTKNLTKIDQTTFLQNTGPSAADYSIAVAAATPKLIFNVPTLSEFAFTVNNVEKWKMTDTSITGPNLVLDNTLVINDSSTNPVDTGIFSRNGADVKVWSGGAVRSFSDIASVLTTKGDLFGYSTATARVPRSLTDGEVLTVDTSDALGVAWASVPVVNSIAQTDSNITITDPSGSGLIVNTVDGGTILSLQSNRIDVQNLPVFGVSALSFYDTTDVAAATVLTQSQTAFTFDMPVNSDTYNFNFNTAAGLSIDLLRTRLYSNTPNTVSAALSLYRDDPSSAADDVVGDINFDGNTVSNGGFFTYADIIGVIADPTAASEDGRVRIRTAIAGNTPENALTIEGPVTTIHQTSSVAGDEATLKLTKVDSTPLVNENVGEVEFIVDDSGTETTYAHLTGFTNSDTGTVTDAGALVIGVRTNGTKSTAVTILGNNNSAKHEWLMSPEARIQPVTGNMAYFTASQVADFSLNIGTFGTMQIPFFNDASVSMTDLNSAFGAFVGAIGYNISDGRLYVRKSGSAWSYYEESGTIP